MSVSVPEGTEARVLAVELWLSRGHGSEPGSLLVTIRFQGKENSEPRGR